MTDEEKASIRDLLKTADIYLSERQTNILCRAFELSITKGYEQGLAEGEKIGKEKQWKATEKAQKKTSAKIKELEKEIEQWKQEWQDAQIKANEEGFARTTLQIKYSELEKENEELKKQIDQLSNDNHVLKTSFITQQEQIKKMKNCGNCNGIINGIRQEKCRFCMRSKLLSEWELAE